MQAIPPKEAGKYHGFKLHINSDRHGMIKKATTTTAKDSDIKELDHLIEGGRAVCDSRQCLYVQSQQTEVPSTRDYQRHY